MKKINLAILSLLVLSACDDRLDFLVDLNQPPSISILDGTVEHAQTFSDSLKTSIKNGSPTYPLILLTKDPEKLVTSVTYRVEGDAKVLQGGQEVTNLTADAEGRVLVEVEPGSSGTAKVQFYVADNLKNSDQVDFTLIAFGNILPVAVLDIVKIGINSALEYDLVADRSYDRDAALGGGLVRYEWDVNGSKFYSNTAISRFIFPQAGSYEIKLRVIDNDGGLSPIVSRILTVN